MGGGFYDSGARYLRATTDGLYTKSSNEIFTQITLKSEMSPYGVKIREARDSEDHPESVPIIIALDLTGSMGKVPMVLIRDGLPTIVSKIIQAGIKDPQILFIGVGDHECDRSPLQIGQFESSDELLDKWLQSVYLEGGGGSNDGESYCLAWYFAGFHTAIDSFEKRNKKGFLFTIGDEPTLKNISKRHLTDIMGKGQYSDFSAFELLDKAREMYEVFHIHVSETYAGSMKSTIDGWKQIIGDHLLISKSSNDIPQIISDKVIDTYKSNSNIIDNVVINSESVKINDINTESEEMML